MYILLACSLLTAAIAVERCLYYRESAGSTEPFLNKLKPLVEKKRLGEAVQYCEQTKGIIGRLALQGIKTYQRAGNLENALEGEAAIAAARLREHLNYLSAVVTLAPLLGLLGTVIGMINSFSVLNVKAGQPMAITGGVGEALVATAAGLTVAIIAMAAHTYFAHRVDKIITDMEQVSTIIINSLTSSKPAQGEHYEIA